MGRIRILPDDLIDRIAAGEVVERPASVVKELVENALDAGARSLEVLLRGGGKAVIEVRDDGTGMSREDAVLAVERHATSKLGAPGDLDAIRTLGFRGEALSSIASVSLFRLRTAERDGEGTEVEIRGGKLEGVREIGHPRGTTVRVERLFHNVPARRKFLRSEATELSHVVRALTRHALARPDLRFRLEHGERRVLETAAAADLAERVAQIYGLEFAEKLLPFELRAEGLTLTGLAGRPVEGLPRRDAQHFFVNGRAVSDRLLSHAVSQAYGNTMPHGRYPALFLFLELEGGAVDVNVHPQKTEVRFRDTSRVHDTVRGVLAEALSQAGAVPTLADLRPGSGVPVTEVREATLRYLETHTSQPRAEAPGLPPAPSMRRLDDEPETPRREAIPLGQYRDSYIVAQDGQGLVLVDQHAAHERVIFERYLEEAETLRVEVQGLMFPVTIELTPDESVVAERDHEEFARLGFRVEPFGERTVRLDGVPALAAAADPSELYRELLGEAAEARSAVADTAALRRRLVTTAACHAAIKIHHPLTAPAMQGLLDDLYATQNPTTCPHGRPVLFRLTLEEIERAFRRR